MWTEGRVQGVPCLSVDGCACVGLGCDLLGWTSDTLRSLEMTGKGVSEFGQVLNGPPSVRVQQEELSTTTPRLSLW